MNVDTDTQWAYLVGIRVSSLVPSTSTIAAKSRTNFQDFVQNKSGYLQTQVGNPEGADKPNKKVRTQDLLLSLSSQIFHW